MFRVALAVLAVFVGGHLAAPSTDSDVINKETLLDLFLRHEEERQHHDLVASASSFVLSTSSTTLTSQKSAVLRRLWTNYRDDDGNYIIPYHISPRLGRNAPAMRSLMQIVREFSSRTCLKMVRRTVGLHRDYIYFVQGRACRTRLGRRGGQQTVMVGGRCTSSPLLMGKTFILTLGLGGGDEDSRVGAGDYKEVLSSDEDNYFYHKSQMITDIIPAEEIRKIRRSYFCATVSTAVPPTRSLAPADGSCGRPVVRPSVLQRHKILGGGEARRGSHPWQVMIAFKRSGSLVCGGALIGRLWALSAAHCFLYSSDPGFYVGFLGKHRKDRKEEGEVRVLFQLLIIHDGYNPTTKMHDIAMVQMAKPITFTSRISSICLPQSPTSLPEVGEELAVTGWGEARGSKDAGALRQAVVPLLNHSLCATWYPALREGMLCAGFEEGGTDACNGDSGGPLIAAAGAGAFRVVGVVSWGDGCGEAKKPGVYTNVAYYLTWIFNVLSLY